MIMTKIIKRKRSSGMLPISKKACPRIVEADRSIDLQLDKLHEQGW